MPGEKLKQEHGVAFEMRRMFLRNPMGHIVSALMPKETMPACLYEGEEVTFLDALELDADSDVPAGTKATVLAHYMSEDNLDCIVELQLHDVRPACLSDGLLILQPYSSDAALGALNGALQRNPTCVVSVVGGETPQKKERKKPWAALDLAMSLTDAERRSKKYMQ